MRRYFKLSMADEARWHLRIQEHFADGTPVDIWRYSRCLRIEDPKPVPFRVQVEGRRVDYNPTAFLATVVSHRVANLLDTIGPRDIQRIAAVVEGAEAGWEVINILACLDCIDHKASLMQYYPPNDPPKPGKPRGVIRLALDPSRIGEHHIFHPKDWEVVTVVSDVVKAALEGIEATGIEFVPVSGLPQQSKPDETKVQ